MSQFGDGEGLFDYWRSREEEIYTNLKRVLGSGFPLLQEVLELHSTLGRLAQRPILQLKNPNQIAAIFHLLAWMRHEAVAAGLMLLRGHVTDSTNFTRRALEICAFIVLIHSDREAGRRWMEAGASKKARQRYTSAFPAWQVVRDQLPKELRDMYEIQCLDVHPSFFAIAKRAKFTAEFKHQFAYSDLSETDPHQTFFVMSFLNLCSTHGKMLAHLANVFRLNKEVRHG